MGNIKSKISKENWKNEAKEKNESIKANDDDFLGEHNDDYKIYEEIENNINFKIFKATNIKEDRKVCLKIIDKKELVQGEYDFCLEQINREEEITKLCKSQYIINIYKRFETKNKIIFELEFWDMNLSEYIKYKKFFLDVDKYKFFLNILCTLTEALKIMNKNGVMHRDLRTSNIFFLVDSHYRKVKLGNFGSSIYIKDNSSEPIGSVFYSAPEILKNLQYDEKCDLWSLGITLYEILFGFLPYGKTLDYNVIKESILYEDNFIYRKSNKKELNLLFDKLLVINRYNRISYKEFFDFISKNYIIFENYIEREGDPQFCSAYNFTVDIHLEEEIDKNKDNYNNSKNFIINKIMNIIEPGHLPDLLNFPNGSIFINEIPKFNNILYYDENINFIKSINKDSNYFEKITPGAFILCTKLDTLKIIKEEILKKIKKIKE